MEENVEGRHLSLKSVFVIATILVTLFGTTGLVYGLLSSQVNVPVSGVFTSANLGVYTTQDCTVNMTSMYWGSVRAGNSYTKTAYVRNNGDLNMTLSMSTSNWNPPALSGVLGFSWNYAGAKLIPGQVVAVTWTLTVPSSGTSGYQSFDFDLTVIGTEV